MLDRLGLMLVEVLRWDITVGCVLQGSEVQMNCSRRMHPVSGARRGRGFGCFCISGVLFSWKKLIKY